MWRLYAEYGRDSLHLAVAGAVATVLSRLFGLAPPLVLGLALDQILLGSGRLALPLVPPRLVPTTALGQLWLVAVLLLGSFALSAGLSWVQNWGWNAFAQRVQHRLRVDAYDRMQDLDMAFFDDKQTGELLSVLNNDVNQLESFLTDAVGSALRIVVLVVGIGFVLGTLNWQLALIALVPVPALALFTLLFVRRIQPKYAVMRASVGALNSRLENNLAGMPVIKTEDTGDHESDRVADASRGYVDANWDAIRTRITFFPGLTLLTGLGFVLTFAVGGYWVLVGAPPYLSGSLTAGAFVTFVIYTQQFTWPLAQFGQLVNAYQRARASADRVFALVTADPEVADAPDATPLSITDGRVEYDGVSFGYDEGAPVLSDVSLAVERGETVGIVGPTGSGKSTLVTLLVRLYDVDSGAIRIDGQDVRHVTVESLRDAVGYVSQEPSLFDGTVADNIAYGRFDATDEEVEAAARRAQAHEFIANLPDGYDTQVGERGVKLSGGQRQRIALARIVLKDPPVLVLDEATSHVDTETEALIRLGLAEFTDDRTTLAIAHRLSTIRDADRIVVLEGGEIVESGTHDELLAADGLYANLWRVQAGEIDALPESFVADAIARRAELDGPGTADESGSTAG
ncbi:MAG: ABC transporter ATP-binding protein [Haloarculaceae archaeon]